MRILALDLLAFGPFTNASLSLADGNHGLHIIYGANEAGKSSALRALTQVLYGIPHNSSDNFFHAHPNMRIGAVIQNRDGDVLQCIRRKGQTNTLRAADDIEVIDPARIAEMLGGVNEATFRERFGIDYRELKRGGEAIIAGRGDLGEILFAAGAGMADLRPLQTKLAVEAEILFKPRGSVQRINNAITELAASRKELKHTQLSSSEWVKHDTALNQAVARKAQIDQQLIEKGAETNRLKRIVDALPLIAQLSRVREDLKDVAAAPILPENFSERRRDTVAQLVSARNLEKETAAAISEIETSIGRLEVPELLLEHRTTITTLHTDLGSYQKGAKDRPNLILKRQHAEEEARAILRDLGRQEDLSEAEKLRLSRTQRLKVQELANECQALVARHTDAKENVRRRREEIKGIEARLAPMDSPLDAAQIQQAVRRAQQQGDLDDRLAEGNAELQRLEEQADVDLQKLILWTGTLEDLEKLPVPVAESIARYEDQLTAKANETELLQRQIDECRHDAQAIDQQLEKLRLEHDVPTEQDLTMARGRRDRGWQLVRQVWLDGAGAGDTGTFIEQFAQDGDLAEAFAASVQAADQIADRLRRESPRRCD